MKRDPHIIILAGGVGPEREISILSGKALFESLSTHYRTKLIDVTERALPSGISAQSDVVFPIIHGDFGEDGELQTLLDKAGFEYCGSGAEASRLCMDKFRAKKRVSENGVRVPRGIEFHDPSLLDSSEIISAFGKELIIKPRDQGSSVSLFLVSGKDELEQTLTQIKPGNWLLEERIFGREVTIGVLEEHTLGIVEVIPVGGVYDYKRKYTPGSTEYRFPAVIDPETEAEIKEFAWGAYRSCGCRDFARVDFMICEDGNAYFLEINTLPGLTTTSLLPKSASSSGYNFGQLTKKLVTPARNRFLGIPMGGEAPYAA
ncbi:MAG: D-alanine--D-alanine ligase [Opitutae bacterium]